MGRLVLALGLVLAISAATGAAQSLPIVKTIFKTSGNVSGIGIEDRDDPVFRLWGALSIFSVHRPSPAKKAQLAGILRTAMQSHRAVQVTYDAASGRVDKQTESIVYSLCSVALDEMVFQPRRPCIDANRTTGTSHSQALALAVAKAEDGDATVARDQLSRIMLGTGLTHAERTIALEARAIALTRLGNSAKSIDVESDAAFLAALADSRSLVALRPDDEQAAANVAQLLIYLGDYDGAIKAIQSMIRRWPQDREKFEISMAVAARQKGDLEESLRFLDDVVANHRHGMRFFYHRGRTLSMMGRYAEAVASFAKGMKTQADYPWRLSGAAVRTRPWGSCNWHATTLTEGST